MNCDFEYKLGKMVSEFSEHFNKRNPVLHNEMKKDDLIAPLL